MVAATDIVVTLAATMVAIVIIGVLSATAATVRLSCNPYFSACFFSRNSVFLSQPSVLFSLFFQPEQCFLSQQISEQYFQP
jgi:hypothetical protein